MSLKAIYKDYLDMKKPKFSLPKNIEQAFDKEFPPFPVSIGIYGGKLVPGRHIYAKIFDLKYFIYKALQQKQPKKWYEFWI